MSNVLLLSNHIKEGIFFDLLPNGQVATNIPQEVVHHSPTGFTWGYLGSGPADFALNILEAVLQAEGYKGKRIAPYNNTTCFALAQALHQRFKRHYIACLPQDEGGYIPYGLVVEFIKLNQQELIDRAFDEIEPLT